MAEDQSVNRKSRGREREREWRKMNGNVFVGGWWGWVETNCRCLFDLLVGHEHTRKSTNTLIDFIQKEVSLFKHKAFEKSLKYLLNHHRHYYYHQYHRRVYHFYIYHCCCYFYHHYYAQLALILLGFCRYLHCCSLYHFWSSFFFLIHCNTF